MAKTIFICNECGYQSSKWLGKCPECNSWNSFTEELIVDKEQKNNKAQFDKISAASVSKIPLSENQRFLTGISEFDRVCGGILKGQTILISGEPGTGKSTLSIMIAAALSKNFDILYVNGEESNSQIKIKFERMNIKSDNIFLFPHPEIDSIIAEIEKKNNYLIIIDSIQTLYSTEISALPGSILQLKECVYKLVSYSKAKDVPLFLIAHITKTGEIAGPKVIEHLVDTVFFLDSDNKGYYRILRSLKNRFFRTDEIGFFTMEETGLISQKEINLNPENYEPRCGVVFFPHIEGSRVIITEVQALCTNSTTNFPRRITYGTDLNRFLMLIAIIEKILKIPLIKYDIYLNITNGLNISDTSLDIAIIMSVFSSFKEKAIPLDISFIGEVGLAGEIRPIKNIQKRIKEISRTGFKKIFIPYTQKEEVMSIENIQIMPAKNIIEIININFSY